MNETVIKVAGMSCDGCVRNVTGVLQALDGVEVAEVSLGKSEARVRYDPARVTVEALREAVERAGFGAPA
jgi:copper chaperone